MFRLGVELDCDARELDEGYRALEIHVLYVDDALHRRIRLKFIDKLAFKVADVRVLFEVRDVKMSIFL